MKIVVDTNRLISALIKDANTRQILLSGKNKFYTIEYSIWELKKHQMHIIKKSTLSPENISALFALIMSAIEIVDEKHVKKNMKEATQILKDVDTGDAPFLAAAIAINADAIFSHDKHLKQQGFVKVVTNKDLH